jgi:hypothetical protein
MKWFAGILIVAVLAAPLILKEYMNKNVQQLGYEKRLPIINYDGTINGKHPFKIAFTREGDILRGTLINTFKKKNRIYGTIDLDDAFLITEYEDGNKVGVLEGRILFGGEMKGTWSTPDGQKWFPFVLVKAIN